MKNQIAYTEHGGLYYPDLTLPEQTNYPLGKYANLRLDFMKKHRRGKYTTLLTEGRLNEYLHKIDLQAHEMLDTSPLRPALRSDSEPHCKKREAAGC
ncbi:MAG: TnpV protein [Clostridia bacterium]|nr:TnpV protein [Clostridia bacterium]